MTKLLIECGEWRIDMFGGPDVSGGFAQCTGPDNDGVGNGAQDAHDHVVVLVVAANVASASESWRFQRYHSVQRCDEIGDHVWPTRLQRKPELAIYDCQFGRKREISPTL